MMYRLPKELHNLFCCFIFLQIILVHKMRVFQHTQMAILTTALYLHLKVTLVLYKRSISQGCPRATDSLARLHNHTIHTQWIEKGERQGKGPQSLCSHMQNEEMSLGARLACMCKSPLQCRNIKHTQKCFNTKTSCAFIAALFSILFFHRCS